VVPTFWSAPRVRLRLPGNRAAPDSLADTTDAEQDPVTRIGVSDRAFEPAPVGGNDLGPSAGPAGLGMDRSADAHTRPHDRAGERTMTSSDNEREDIDEASSRAWRVRLDRTHTERRR
jgi:hypothetical protein